MLHITQLPTDIQACIIPHCTRTAKVQHSRLSAATGAVRIVRGIMSQVFTLCVIQIPEGHQESARCSADAEKQGFRVQPDGGRRKAGSGAVDPGLRYVKIAFQTIWVLID